MVFKFKREWYSKHFGEVLLSRHRYLICMGGRGSGKTNHIILKLLAATFQDTQTIIYYCRAEFETIRKTTFEDIKNYLKNNDDLRPYFDYRESINSSMIFTNKITGNKMIPFGLDKPEVKTKGVSEACIVWIDEISECTFEQFSFINSVLRTPKAEYLQFIGSFNPVRETHWLRNHFFSEENAYVYDTEKFHNGEILIHHSTVRDNEYIDQDAYIRNLMQMYGKNRQLVNVNVKGLWGAEENNDPWLYAFDSEVHVKEDLPFMPSFPVYLAFDFNREPLTCVATQMSPKKGGRDSFIHHIKEFCGDMQLEEICSQIKATYPYSILYVTGDATSNKGDVTFSSRHSTYYTLIRSLLNLSEKQMNIPKKNFEHNDSRLLCNTMLNTYPNIYISAKGCPKLIEDCEKAEVDDRSPRPGHLKKDRKMFKLDLFDGWRYFYQTYFSDFVKSVYLRDPKT